MAGGGAMERTNQRKRKSVLVMAVLLFCLSACGSPASGKGVEAEQGELQVSEEFTLDWYVNYSWFAMPWGENLVSRAITEKTGVAINFITPIGNETEKLNALISSDTLPDIITLGYWEPQVEEMVQKDMVYALNELADRYVPEFWQVADEMVLNWYTHEDGNVYVYPNSSISPKDLEENESIGSNQTFLVRKDIYEAIGSPDMTTPEGFAAAVKKAAELFPEVEGKPLIPVGAHSFDNEGNVSFDKYLMNFLAVPWEQDGKLYDRYTDAEYIEWLKMFRELGEQGYLAADIFVDTRTQMEEKLTEGRYFCMIYQYTDMLAQQKVLYEKNSEQIYMAVEGPRNSRGEDPTLPCTSISGWTLTLISKNCENPERAMEFITYLMSEEGQKTTFLGVEGEMYRMVDGVPVQKDEVRELLATDRGAYDQKYGADNAYWMLQNLVMQQRWQQSTSPAEEQLKEWSRKYVVYNGQYEIMYPAGSRASVINEKVTRLWSETLPKLLLAPSEEEFDVLFAEFVVERDKLGYPSMMEAGTAYMLEAKKKLGMME